MLAGKGEDLKDIALRQLDSGSTLTLTLTKHIKVEVGVLHEMLRHDVLEAPHLHTMEVS